MTSMNKDVKRQYKSTILCKSCVRRYPFDSRSCLWRNTIKIDNLLLWITMDKDQTEALFTLPKK